MGLSLRIYLVNDDDSVQRFPLARYERLVRRDPKERFPQYAGKRVRYAEVAVELAHRKPVGTLRLQYFILSFDSEGQIDTSEQQKERRLSADMMPPLIEQSPSRVIDAQHRFAKKHLDHRYRWTPSPELEAAIVHAIFGKNGFFLSRHIFVRPRKTRVQMSKVPTSYEIPVGFHITRLRRCKKKTSTALCLSEPRTKRFVMNVCSTGK